MDILTVLFSVAALLLVYQLFFRKEKDIHKNKRIKK